MNRRDLFKNSLAMFCFGHGAVGRVLRIAGPCRGISEGAGPHQVRRRIHRQHEVRGHSGGCTRFGQENPSWTDSVLALAGSGSQHGAAGASIRAVARIGAT